MKCVIVPVRDIKALETARKKIFALLKDTSYICDLVYSITDKMYTITHSRYKEIEYKYQIKKEHTESQSEFSTFHDQRGRTWEWFIDESYYHCTCVRLKGETDFNSPLSFHFNTSDIALDFINLLKQSS